MSDYRHINFDCYYDPPDIEEPPIAVKCKKCGRFVKFLRMDSEYIPMLEDYDEWRVYHCSQCGEITEKDTQEIFA